jgi:magnesium transporter
VAADDGAGRPPRWRRAVPYQSRRPRPAPRPTHPPVVTDREIESVIGDCARYTESGRVAGRLSLAEAAEQCRRAEGFVWIGLQQPTSDELAVVAAEFALPALAVEDAVVAHQRPKLEAYDGVLFAVLKPVSYLDHDEVVDVSEIAIFVGPHFVVTVRHGATDVLGRVRAELDEDRGEQLRHGPTAVLYRSADLVVDQYEEVADFITTDVEEIEAQVFGGDSRDHAERIYKLKREVLQFRRAVLPLAEPMRRLAAGEIPGLATETRPYFRDVHDHLLRASDAIEGHDRMLTDVLTAELAQVGVRQTETAVRQNEDMRKISAWAAIALVPTAIAGIYGMNFDNMPELHWQYGYPLVIGVILAACSTLYVLFRRNGWL